MFVLLIFKSLPERGHTALIQLFIMLTKRILVVITLFVCCLAGMAQDIIVCKDGTSLLGKVAEITESEVKYRKADHPDGPLYTIKIADLLRINYQNGQSDVFSQDGAVPSTVLAGATGDVKDTSLLDMYKKNKVDYSLPKKLKLTAFIGGGALIAAGIGILVAGTSPENRPALWTTGACLTAVGVVWMPTFYMIAKHKQKKLDELACVPLYRHEIFSKGGNSLSMGVDMMADRMMTRTLGLGMTFNF